MYPSPSKVVDRHLAAAKGMPKWVQQAVRSGKGVEGRNGARAIGYEWKSYLGEKYSDYEGGLVGARVSDWDNAERCATCNRPIVHVFWVQEKDGSVRPYGRDHLHIALGYPRELSKNQVESIRRKVVNREQIEEKDATLRKHYQKYIELRASPSVQEANAAFSRGPMGKRLEKWAVWFVHPQRKLIMRGDDLLVDRFLKYTKGWIQSKPSEFYTMGGKRRPED